MQKYFGCCSARRIKAKEVFDVDMANSKYEYVKSFEVEDEVMLPNLIVVRIYGRDFRRFSEAHEFKKPNDKRALKLMRSCAASVLEEYPDIVFSYGFNDEYSFVLKRTSKFYQRRASKILSVIVSFFTSLYAIKWKEYFPGKELRYPPSFHSQVISCASMEVLQEYLAWRQNDCHVNNLYYACLWMLIKSGKAESEAQEILKGTEKPEKNELLYKQFDVNYNKYAVLFRQGSCVLKAQVEDIVKYNEDGPVKRMRTKVMIFPSKESPLSLRNIVGRSFWNQHPYLLKELGSFTGEVRKINPELVKSFQFENKLMPSTWIVVRIDGRHFHRFSEVHEFEKPNDWQALSLMNSCAVAVFEEFQDIILSYGVSDEYSFVLTKDSQLYQRRASAIVSIIVSFFSAKYVLKWKEFFPQKELKYPPSFDGRAVCYPSSEILQDYLAWRQVDCHINNQYNTCFWMLAKSGKSKREAQNYLKKDRIVKDENGSTSVQQSHGEVIVDHCNIIDPKFWKEHPSILDDHSQIM
ncbi:tRNA(His) guanylyltransferase 1-like isoform X2 [Malania oleifera]|uniref:tRNA(His) guanylyltransferase 1-like isoform X2 n=1 Tax=Malania oleifera TaxID=397392 RepID=UPI0025AE9D11|nr:tRNA(His) guanylyltransferase 1-like isoform X2 [Malania oleifera]XP_057971565.1 tRNA(His) guanylyltransferase 1-like isoform X2 [Malania oleifera]